MFAVLVSGCDDDLKPDPARVSRFDLTADVLPYSTDLHFDGSTDGTLNIQPASTPLQSETNSLDGFSTSAVIRERFDSPPDPASLTARSVRVVEVRLDNATKRITTLGRELGVGPERMALAFSFSTEAPLNSLHALASPAITPARAIEVVDTDQTTTALNPALPGHANLVKGTL